MQVQRDCFAHEIFCRFCGVLAAVTVLVTKLRGTISYGALSQLRKDNTICDHLTQSYQLSTSATSFSLLPLQAIIDG